MSVSTVVRVGRRVRPIMCSAKARSWAARPIFPGRRTHRLTRARATEQCLRCGGPGRDARVALAVLAARSTRPPRRRRASTRAGACRGPTRRSQQAPRAAALRVPQRRDRCASRPRVAVDLETGEQLFALNATRAARARVEREARRSTFALLDARSARGCGSRRGARGGRSQSSGTLEGRPRARRRRRPDADEPATCGGSRAACARAASRRVTGGVLGDESLFDSMRTCPGWKPYFYINESPPLSALVVDRASVPQLYGATAREGCRAPVPRRPPRRRGSRSAATSACGRPRRRAAARQDASAPLASIVAYMDLHSDNFTAEQLLKLLGR